MARIYFEVPKGRLGADPEFKVLDSDRLMVKLSIAINHYRKDEDGEFEEDGTSWLRCVAFGYIAEQIEAMELEKGDQVFAKGNMRETIYEDEDGDEQFSWDYYLNTLFPIPRVFEEEDEEEDRPRRKKKKKKRGKKKKKSKGRLKKRPKKGKKKKRGKKKKGSKSKDLTKQVLSQLKS